jgi:hypothetical protein
MNNSKNFTENVFIILIDTSGNLYISKRYKREEVDGKHGIE